MKSALYGNGSNPVGGGGTFHERAPYQFGREFGSGLRLGRSQRRVAPIDWAWVGGLGEEDSLALVSVVFAFLKTNAFFGFPVLEFVFRRDCLLRRKFAFRVLQRLDFGLSGGALVR